MNPEQTGNSSVPGTSLYYEIRGSGPTLLMIAAGAGDADSYGRLVEYLVDQYTVITYDRRGYSRSPVDDADQQIDISTHADDAFRLLTALSSEPTYVFGCSIGALIALELVSRHTEKVRKLVAHEPPIGQLLPKGERTNASLPEMARREGTAAALKQFAASIGVNHPAAGTNLGLEQKTLKNAENNRRSFFKHDVGAVARYQLDLVALKSVRAKIVLAGGSTGREYFPYRCTVALANKLEMEMVEFPGNHAGFVDYPQEFAKKLQAVLTE